MFFFGFLSLLIILFKRDFLLPKFVINLFFVDSFHLVFPPMSQIISGENLMNIIGSYYFIAQFWKRTAIPGSSVSNLTYGKAHIP